MDKLYMASRIFKIIKTSQSIAILKVIPYNLTYASRIKHVEVKHNAIRLTEMVILSIGLPRCLNSYAILQANSLSKGLYILSGSHLALLFG